MNPKTEKKVFARIVNLSRNELAEISNEARYPLKKGEEAPAIWAFLTKDISLVLLRSKELSRWTDP